MNTWHFPVLRAVQAALYAGLWLLVPLAISLTAGRSGPAWSLAAGAALWAAVKATGWEVQLPELDEFPSARILAAILALAVLLVFCLKGGVWGVLLFGFVLGTFPLTPVLTAVAVVLSLVANALLLDRLGGALWVRCAWGTLYTAGLLGFLQMHQWLGTRDDPTDLAGLGAVLAWGTGLLPPVALVAYLLTMLLHPERGFGERFPSGTVPQTGPASPRDFFLLVAGAVVFLVFWRRLAALLDRRQPRVPGLDAETVLGETEDLVKRTAMAHASGAKGACGQLLAAFLDFFEFLAWHGFPRRPGTPADLYLESVACRVGGLGGSFRRVAAVFDRIRYGGEPTPKEIVVQTRRELRTLRRAVATYYTTRQFGGAANSGPDLPGDPETGKEGKQ
ncbi:MAG: DUF4129 domain-containing protein [Kiritimatiellaeota bacterium]|nr:DUF4129 domain-containing protein [Kiritimatiellota bacterium]